MKNVRHLFLSCILTLIVTQARAEDIPFEKALDAAAVGQDRLDNLLERSLILGNGDVNGLLYSQGGNLILRLTKNDVWDARIDTSGDPPLLKIDIKNKKLTGPTHGPIYSWDKPYPCPRVCGQVILGDSPLTAMWRTIRAGGKHNDFQWHDGAAVMSIEGAPGASNGYALSPLDFSTDECPTLRVKLSGTANAQFFVDVMATGNRPIFGTKWIKTPESEGERTFTLPPGQQVEAVILYTWTTDGKRAENHFTSVTFEGDDRKVAVDLEIAKAAKNRPAVLDLRRAVARVEGEEAGQPATVVRALADRNVFFIESPMAAQLGAIAASYLPAAETGEDNHVQWLRQKLPADLDWPGMTFVVAVASVEDRKAVAIVTSLEVDDPLAEAIRLAQATLAAERKTLIEQHEQAWHKFWSASGVDLDDTDLRNMWYRNLYFLRCVSKPGVEAIGLYASLTNDSPPWHGSHTLNYNSEQTFWTSYVTNHVELSEPYERMVFRYLPRARWFARQTYNCGGAHIPHNIFAHETFDPEKCRSKNNRMHSFPPYAHTIGVSGFVVQNLWHHYKYQPDKKYLEEIAYPAVRDVAIFYADFMDQCETVADGKVLLAPSYSPEHWSLTPDFKYNRNGTFDIAFAAFTFKAAIEAAGDLGRDAELAARFEKALQRLPDYPTTQADKPVVVDMLDAPPITYNITVPVVPVFPADQVTWFSPEAEKDLFVRTIETVKWTGYNSSIILSVARARLSMPDTWKWVKETLLFRSRPNGTITLLPGDGCGHFTEQFAASMAVSELLIQSVGDIIRVFPAWPSEKSARFENLRAQGGFLVSAEQTDGQVKEIIVTSTVGGRLRILDPWTGKKIIERDTQPGQTLVFRR